MSEVYRFLSNLERRVYDWLTKNKINFTTQEKMFGVRELGSAVVDFVIADRNLCWRIMGGYWHSSLEAQARDELGKERLMNEGYIVVDLQEKDLTDANIERTLRLAWMGQEVL